jgi:hypothetical protein
MCVGHVDEVFSSSVVQRVGCSLRHGDNVSGRWMEEILYLVMLRRKPTIDDRMGMDVKVYCACARRSGLIRGCIEIATLI